MAVQLYRDVLRLIDEMMEKHGVKTDILQRIHILHNLQQVLGRDPGGVGHCLHDVGLCTEVGFHLEMCDIFL